MSVFNESISELAGSIYSILGQTYPNFEFIILDDNPKSNVIRKYLLNLNDKYSKIRLFFNHRNLGAALSRNKGIQYSSGKFIAIMDADDVAKKNRLVAQYRFLKKYNLDLVFPNYERISGNGSILDTKTYNIPSITNQNKMYYIFSCIGNVSINSGWLVKKTLFEKLHGYRNVTIEDYDFITRALTKKYKLGYQSDVLMSVRFRQNSIMRKNVLLIYLLTRYLKKYLKGKYKSISIKNIQNNVYSKINKKRTIKLNKLLVFCHKVKYKHHVLDIIKLIYYILVTKFSCSFIASCIIPSIKMKILYENKK